MFFEDIHFLFKHSSAQRENYTSLESITNVTARYAVRHATTRWVSMKYLAVRIYKQVDNLKEYFFTTFLPKQKREYYLVKKTERYQRIVKALRDNLTIGYVSFCAFASDGFKAFLLLFQYDQPMIHV